MDVEPKQEHQMRKNASLIVSIKTAFDLPNRTRDGQPNEFGRETLNRPE